MKFNRFEPEYLTAGDLKGPVTIIITSIEQEVIDEPVGEVERQVLHTDSDLPGIVLREPHLALLAQIFGTKEQQDWIGKRVIVFPDPDVWLYGRRVGGIRFKSVDTDREEKHE